MLRRVIDWATTDWALKLTALVLAFLMWVTVRADAPGQWNAEIAVRVDNNDGDWVVAEPPAPRVVTAVFRGPYRELLRTASDLPEVVIPVQQVNDSTEVHVLRPNWVRMPPSTDNTTVVNFQPATVQITFDHVFTRLVPVAAPLSGQLPPGYEIRGGIEIEPIMVRASGAARTLARIDSLRLPPIDLRDRRDYDTLDLTIDTTGTGLIISPRTVRVFLPVYPIMSDSALQLVPNARPPTSRP